MKKSYKHTEMSNRKCAGCGKRLKKNVVERKAQGKMLLCYKCFQEAKLLQQRIA